MKKLYRVRYFSNGDPKFIKVYATSAQEARQIVKARTGALISVMIVKEIKE